MEQKIDLEIRLRELAAQSLLEARTEIDVLEVEKSLLSSDQRMNCYAIELERQRKQLSNPSLSTADDSGSVRGSRGNSGSRDRSLARLDDSKLSRTGGRSDVIGAAGLLPTGGSQTTSSPSFSSLSNSQSSPSKLSPVSGQSNNSLPASHFDSSSTKRRTSRAMDQSNGNTLNRNRPRVQRNKRREHFLQSITSQSNINCNLVNDNKATLSISELRIPLMWRDVDHFKGRGDYKRYAIFCLLKIGSQIYDTQLITDVDRQMTDVTFDDLIVFHNLSHDFELELEIYSCVYLEQFSLSSTPRKLREKLSSSVSRAMGRRLATQTASAQYTRELEAYDKSYRFAMIASATLRLPDASDSVKTYDLVLVSPTAHNRHHLSSSSSAVRPHETGEFGPSSTTTTTTTTGSTTTTMTPKISKRTGIVTASNQKDAERNTLPLFGHFCCKILVKPDVFDKTVKTGYLQVARSQLSTSNGAQIQASRRSVDSPVQSESTSSSGDSTSGDSMLRSAGKKKTKQQTELTTATTGSAAIHWALLRNFTLHLWPVDEAKLEADLKRGLAPQVDISQRPPFTFAIDRYSRLLRVSNSSLTIETDKGCFVLFASSLRMATTGEPSGDGIGQWLRPIEQLIYDSHIWGSVLNHYPPNQNRLSAHQQQVAAKQSGHKDRLRDRRQVTDLDLILPSIVVDQMDQQHGDRYRRQEPSSLLQANL